MTDDKPKGPPGFTWRGYEFPEFEMEPWYGDRRGGRSFNAKLMCAIDCNEVRRGKYTYQARTDYPTGSKHHSQRTDWPGDALENLRERIQATDTAKLKLLNAGPKDR